MPAGTRPSRRAAAAAGLAASLLALAAAGCATLGGPAARRTPEEAHRALLNRNPGLESLRAVVEARISFAGGEVSLPGVLLLQRFGGYRLDLLDPLDRPVAIVFPEGQRIVQYRPAAARAASLATIPAECRGVSPSDWVAAVLSNVAAPPAGESESVRPLWGGAILERGRGGAVRQSVRFTEAGGGPVPGLYSWYCDEEPVLQLRVRGWRADPVWRLPSSFDLSYPRAGLAVRIDLREVEANPPPTAAPLRPRLGPDTGWSSWTLPR